MGFLDALFGKSRPPKARLDKLFALSTAAVPFAELGWTPAGRCGLTLKPATSIDFRSAAEELKELLHLAVEETKTRMEIRDDEYRYRWLLFEDPDWDDLVALVHMAAQTLAENGYDTQLLAAVFPFKGPGGEKLYIIYNYKRGSFYPYLPTGKEGRDHNTELRLFTLLEKELPWEKDVGFWYPIRNCPV